MTVWAAGIYLVMTCSVCYCGQGRHSGAHSQRLICFSQVCCHCTPEQWPHNFPHWGEWLLAHAWLPTVEMGWVQLHPGLAEPSQRWRCSTGRAADTGDHGLSPLPARCTVLRRPRVLRGVRQGRCREERRLVPSGFRSAAKLRAGRAVSVGKDHGCDLETTA